MDFIFYISIAKSFPIQYISISCYQHCNTGRHFPF